MWSLRLVGKVLSMPRNGKKIVFVEHLWAIFLEWSRRTPTCWRGLYGFSGDKPNWRLSYKFVVVVCR